MKKPKLKPMSNIPLFYAKKVIVKSTGLETIIEDENEYERIQE